jgi:hypothetical protein
MEPTLDFTIELRLASYYSITRHFQLLSLNIDHHDIFQALSGFVLSNRGFILDRPCSVTGDKMQAKLFAYGQCNDRSPNDNFFLPPQAHTKSSTMGNVA